MSTKVDLKKELKSLYRASSRKPAIVDVPPLNFLMVDDPPPAHCNRRGHRSPVKGEAIGIAWVAVEAIID